MNNFLEFINKDIEGKKENIQSMPTKTKANKKKFNDTITEYTKKYQDYKDKLFKYMSVKAAALSKVDKGEDINKIKEKVVSLERVKFLLNPSNTYLEKMGFDTLIYQINNYYTLNFKSLNVIINGFLDKFDQAGIHLNCDDFDYTCYVHEYMSAFLDVRHNKDKDYTKVSQIFEQIYWLNPEIIQHIELNFRKLIRKNQKKLNAYISSLQREEMAKTNVKSYAESIEELQEAYIELNMRQKETIADIIELSKSGAIDIEQYLESSKVRTQAYQSLIADSFNLDDKDKMNNICDALEKFKLNISELTNYYEFSALFKDFKSKYEKIVSTLSTKKTNHKSFKDIEVQIDKKEEELSKLNKRIYSNKPRLFKVQSDVELKNLKMETVIKAKELYELYKKYDEEYFNDEVMQVLSGTMSISDLLNLYYSFDYFKKIAIQKVYRLTTYEDVIKYSENFDLYAMNPTNVIINGVAVFQDSNLPRIIANKYRLSNIHIEEEDLIEDNLKPLLNKINIILRTHKIDNSSTSIEKIWFITKVNKYKLENEKTNE
ncbi:MAG: hypothetical protein J6C28_03180 [Bacilli bacterium]|nr:hypothetical protein [Bacilli bacterium]